MSKGKKGKKTTDTVNQQSDAAQGGLFSSEAIAGDPASENATERRVISNIQYVKDLSFENPNSPISLRPSNEQPRIEVTVNINAQRLQGETFEVALQALVSAKFQEKTAFLVDLTYAGVFTLEQIPDEEREAILLVYCPTLLFPFVRRIISDTTRDGGFPPLMVDPIDFSNLYQSRKRQNRQEVA
ncbi:MAG: protein-export chaperone SecB [Alphaproteobacteria bacterium]|nr:protein-export chaperone SecB [Alphaproteobacteria bacterium]